MRALAAPATAPSRTSTDRDSDSDLVARVRDGDDGAFERLYERYHRRIAAYIYGMVQDYGRAEDIAQDVFMSALRRMRETEREIAFKPWAYEIAKNACIDQFRRARRAEEVSYDAEEGLGAADYGKLVMGGPTPEVAVDQKLSLDHLRGAFSGLSQTHHEILVMRELEGLSYREIGEKLGMSRPSVESTLFRARRRLSEEYEELITGERCLRVQQIISAAAAGALGARDGRKLAAHVSHCQACRRHARVAGVDEALFVRPGARAKVAALLPLPAFLKRRWEGGDAAANGGSGFSAQWMAYGGQVSTYAEPAMGWVKAGVVAATVAAAGVGATQVTTPSGALGLPEGDDAPSRSAKAGDGGERATSAARSSSAGRAGAGGASSAARGGAAIGPASVGTSSSVASAAGDKAGGTKNGAATGTTAAAVTAVPPVGTAPAEVPASAAPAPDGVKTLADALDPNNRPNSPRPPSGAPPAPAPAPAPEADSAPALPAVPNMLGDGSETSESGDPISTTAGQAGAVVGDVLDGP